MKIAFWLVICSLAVVALVLVAQVVMALLTIVAATNLEGPGLVEGEDISSLPAQLTPQWTPDSERIVFGDWTHVYIVESDGSRLQELDGAVSESGRAHSPSVSPDGNQVAFVTKNKVHTMDLDGSGRRRLDVEGSFHNFPAWSPDGNRIAIVSDYKAYTTAPDGSEVRSIARSLFVQWGAPPVWSSDGRSLAILRSNQFSASECGDRMVPTGLYIAGEDGSRQREIGQIFKTALPMWSPDGLWVIFPTPSEEGCDLAAMQAVAPDGSASSTILTYPRSHDISDASWSPDGSAILMGSTIVKADGSEARAIAY